MIILRIIQAIKKNILHRILPERRNTLHNNLILKIILRHILPEKKTTLLNNLTLKIILRHILPEKEITGHVGGVMASHPMILVIVNMKEIMMIMIIEVVVLEGVILLGKEHTLIILHRNIHMMIISLNHREEVEEEEVDMLSLNIEKSMIQEAVEGVEEVIEENVGNL
jgi:hypothetical protein